MSTVVLIKGNYGHHLNAKNWCIDNIGIDCINLEFGNWFCHGVSKRDFTSEYISTRGFVFKHEDDAVMFKLRWS